MNRRLVLATAAALIAAPATAATPIALGEPKPLPTITFETLDGEPADLAAHAGKVIVLNLWATWCQPCREEMPSLVRLQEAFEGQDVVVVALSVDRAGSDRVRRFLDEVGAGALEVFRDPKAAATRTLKVPGLPATLLIDRRGREVSRVLGIAEWDGEEAQAAVRTLLDSSAG